MDLEKARGNRLFFFEDITIKFSSTTAENRAFGKKGTMTMVCVCLPGCVGWGRAEPAPAESGIRPAQGTPQTLRHQQYHHQ